MSFGHHLTVPEYCYKCDKTMPVQVETRLYCDVYSCSGCGRCIEVAEYDPYDGELVEA